MTKNTELMTVDNICNRAYVIIGHRVIKVESAEGKSGGQ